MLYGFFLFIHIIVSILLVVIILMQASKGGGLAGLAGGAATQAVLGGRQAATLLHKVTVILALVFGINCMLLGVLSKTRDVQHSVTQETMQAEESPLDFLSGEEATSAPAGGEEVTPAAATEGETE
jgi:preprotein translocase subunit SecG